MRSTRILAGLVLTGKFIVAIVASILAATGLMSLLYCLPVEPMQENVWRSNSIYTYEGAYPMWAGENYKMSQLDNITDGYMLLEAIYPGTDHPIENAMLSRYAVYDDVNPQQAALMAAHGDTPSGDGSYARYWHGYLLFLKPLLLVFDVADIRIINMILCLGLSLLLIRETQARLGRKAAVAMFVTLLVINPVSVIMSFQFSTTFYVMMATAMLVLGHDAWLARGDRYAMLFLFIGIVTNYVDFLTYPLVGMAIPLLLAVMLREQRQEKGTFGFVAYSGIAWGIGYACMWIGKWVMATLITGRNIIQDAVDEATVQSTGQEEIFGTTVSAINAIYKNVRVVAKWPFIILALFIMLWTIWYLLRKNRRVAVQLTVTDLMLILIALLPLAWYLVFQSHSISCYWFTYRNLSITILAMLLFLGRRVTAR